MDQIGMDDVIATFVALGVAVGPFALGVTKMVDFLRNLLDTDDTWPKWTWNVAAFGVAIAVSVGWGFNLVAALVDSIPRLADSTMFDGTNGQLLTGFLIGGAAGYWHSHLEAKSSAATNILAAGSVDEVSVGGTTT